MTRSLAYNAGLRSKPTEWMDRARCATTPTHVMFPDEPGRHGTIAAEQAAAICRTGCPVITDCLTYAMTEPVEKYGVWGGLSEPARRQLRTRRRWDA